MVTWDTYFNQYLSLCVIHRHNSVQLLKKNEGSSHCVSPVIRTVAREHSQRAASISYQGIDKKLLSSSLFKICFLKQKK